MQTTELTKFQADFLMKVLPLIKEDLTEDEQMIRQDLQWQLEDFCGKKAS